MKKTAAKHCPPSRQQHREKQTEANREGKQRLAPLHGEEEERTDVVTGLPSHRPPSQPSFGQPPLASPRAYAITIVFSIVSATRFAPFVSVYIIPFFAFHCSSEL
jgi:hypothetical protein